MSSVPLTPSAYTERIKKCLSTLFPSSDQDLKVHVTAMTAFLANSDPENTKVKALKGLESELVKQINPENQQDIQNIFEDQIKKRIHQFSVAIKTFEKTKAQQQEFANQTISHLSKTATASPPSERVQNILSSGIPLSDLGNLEASVLIMLAAPIYEEKLKTLRPEQAALVAIEDSQRILDKRMNDTPSLTKFRSSLSGRVIRFPVDLTGDEKVNGLPSEYFEKDEIEDYILKRKEHPYSLKRSLTLEEVHVDEILQRAQKKAFTKFYQSILKEKPVEGSNLDLSPLIHTAKFATITNDKWYFPKLSEENKAFLQKITAGSLLVGTQQEKVLATTLIALAFPSYEELANTPPEEAANASLQRAQTELTDRLERDPVLSHWICPITHAIMKNPTCITYSLGNGLSSYRHYEAYTVTKLKVDPLSRQPIETDTPALELKNFIQNREEEVCSSILLNKDLKFLEGIAENHPLKIIVEDYIGRDERKERAILSIRLWILSLSQMNTYLQADKDVVLAAVNQNGRALLFASEDLQKDKVVVLAAVNQNGMALEFAHEDLQKDKDVVLAAVNQNGWSLQYASGDLRKDRDIVLAAVSQNERALLFASEDLQKDKVVVLAAVNQNGMALEFAHEDLQKDKDVVLAAVNQNGRALLFASVALQKDKVVVLAAVKQDGKALRYAPEDLQKDKVVVLAAVKQDGKALQYASVALRKDRDIVLAAVNQNGWGLQYVFENLRKDRDVVLAAVTNYELALHYAFEDLKKDRDVVLAAVNQNGRALQYAFKDLKKDKAVVLAAVNQNGWGLQYASEDLRNDKDVVLAAVKQDGNVLQYASEDLQKDIDVVLAAINQNGSALEYASEDLRNDKDVVLAAVNQNGGGLQYASEDLKKDKVVVLAAVKQDGMALKFASKDLQKDRDVVLAAVRQKKESLTYADTTLKNDLQFLRLVNRLGRI